MNLSKVQLAIKWPAKVKMVTLNHLVWDNRLMKRHHCSQCESSIILFEIDDEEKYENYQII